MSAEVEGALRDRTPFWLDVALAVLFGVFFAYDVWEAVGNLDRAAQGRGARDLDHRARLGRAHRGARRAGAVRGRVRARGAAPRSCRSRST